MKHFSSTDLESQFLLQGKFVFHFHLAEVVHCIRLRDLLVVVRGEIGVIDAVDDTAQIFAPCVHQSIQALAVELGLDLLRIGRGNSRNGIRIDQTALEEVGILVGLKLIGCEIITGETGDILDITHIPLALELQVVDGHNRLDSLVELAACETLFQIDGNKSGLPVVAVDQVRAEIHGGKCGENRFGEERETCDLKQRIICIRLVTGEESFVVDEIEGDSLHLGLQHTYILTLPVEVHVEVCDIFHLVLHLLLHAGILGHDHPDVIIFLIQFLGKRTDNICQSACLDKRNALRCHKKNLLHI